MKPRLRIRGVATVMLVISAAAAGLVPLPSVAVERSYSNGIYPWIQRTLTPVSNLTSFALLDLAASALLLLLMYRVAILSRSEGWTRGAVGAVVILLQSSAIIYLLFLALWGLNYRRVPLEDKLDFDRTRVTVQRASELAAQAVRRLNALHGPAHARTADVSALPGAFESAARAMGADHRLTPGRPKRSLLGLYFRKAAIDGMTDPFFLEVILNPDLLPIEVPEVLTHEWAHLAGYADESEANFLAWLTCLRGDSLAQYSGWLSAYLRVSSALPRELRAALPRLDDGPRADLRAIAARYNRSSTVVRRAASDVYDTYLKANRIPEGIANYDEVTKLMLGTTLGSEWNPR